LADKKIKNSDSLNKNKKNQEFTKIINDLGCSKKAANAIWLWYDYTKPIPPKNLKQKQNPHS